MSEKPNEQDLLRVAAEAKLAHVPKLPPRPAEVLLHELQVYQIELEMQNEQLRQTQLALEESRDRFMNLYEFAPVGYLTLNEQGLISEINLTGAALLKRERGKLLHKRFNLFVAPESHERWHVQFADLLRHAGSQSLELVLKNGDGEIMLAYLDCRHHVADDKQHVLRISFSDITYWRKAEESMREWQAFVENATWGMTIGEVESRVIRLANPAYARMHGYTVEELHNLQADVMYAPESRANLPHYVECVRKNGYHSFECVRLRKDGSTFPAEVDISVVDGIGGKATVMVNVKDITERKLAKLQLIESEHKFGILADSGQALIWTSGTDKLRNYFNQTWLNFTGRSLEQEIGNGWKEGVHPDDLQRCIGVYTAAFGRREKFSMDYRLMHRDGNYRWVQDDGCPRYNSKNEFVGYIGYCLDITVRKKMERKMRELASHLQTVREEEKTRIARELHDELGGTLTALKLDNYWLARKLPANEETALFSERIESMSQLIDNAVGVTRRIISDLRPTILDDLGLLAALEWQAVQFNKHTGIECRVTCIEDQGGLDKPRSIALFRILQESLNNVSRHSGASKVEIEFIHGQNELSLTVSDNGRGIPDNHVVLPSSYGMLGMTERANQLGGRISFGSSPSGGLSVVVTLPLPDKNNREKDE
ncbi:MAG: PAS domain S-box protein [Gallionella sp.]|nr:PAS domain S-box protein [Gallionella sp.]